MDSKVLGRYLLQAAAALFALFALCAAVVIAQAWPAMGKAAEGSRLQRMQSSPQYGDGVFVNPQPMWNDVWGTLKGAMNVSDYASPQEPPPFERVDSERLATPPPTGLRVTWLGHSMMLIEIDGHRILTDPFWGPRSSPLTWAGPERWYPPPLAVEDLPKLDAVLISHDHYDHLDYPSIMALKDHDTTFVAPLGVAAHLEYWGVPAERIVEMDWWEQHMFGDLQVVCTPARHASGRHVFDQNHTLWASYALVGTQHRAYFSGDTGLFPALKEIGERFGPFDVTMMEAGAYDQAWPDWHLGPEQAVLAHKWVQGKTLLAVHWGLFNLAYHGWTEPIERVLVAAQQAGVTTVVPRPGASFQPEAPPPVERWWPQLPWRTAKEYPIEARGL